jgi:peptidoglycan/xylan/chitin deacetylase (PgdA/CDA1 family)
LAILDKYGVKATFFLPGNNVNSWEVALVAGMLEDGHAVGIHSFNHAESLETNGLTNQELADQHLAAYWRIFDLLAEYPHAQAMFATQPPLYRRPGGSPHLNYFLDPGFNVSLHFSSQERRLIESTYDYSGWSLALGDTVPMVLRQIRMGDSWNGADEENQTQATEAFWDFLWSGTLPSGTKTNYPGLVGLEDSEDAQKGLVILAHDTYLTSVRSWDVIIPRLQAAGYVFAVLPRPSDSPNSFILGMG